MILAIVVAVAAWKLLGKFDADRSAAAQNANLAAIDTPAFDAELQRLTGGLIIHRFRPAPIRELTYLPESLWGSPQELVVVRIVVAAEDGIGEQFYLVNRLLPVRLVLPDKHDHQKLTENSAWRADAYAMSDANQLGAVATVRQAMLEHVDAMPDAVVEISSPRRNDRWLDLPTCSAGVVPAEAVVVGVRVRSNSTQPESATPLSDRVYITYAGTAAELRSTSEPARKVLEDLFRFTVPAAP